MEEELYQKIAVAVNHLAQDLLCRGEGERIPSISEYQQMLGVSRGTVQNCLTYLKENGAVSLVSRGHLGTFVEKLDYPRLQACSFKQELLGAMPLPYSTCYQGLATALYRAFSPLSFNLVYVRGAESRLRLIRTGVCQFVVCSRFAAQEAIRSGEDIQILMDLGPESYLSSHVLVMRDPRARCLEKGMKVAYDKASLDHRYITEHVCAGIDGIHLVPMRAHHTVAAIRNGEIDAGVWNLDEIRESGYDGLNLLPLDRFVDVTPFSSAVLVIRAGEKTLGKLLSCYAEPQLLRTVQKDVQEGKLPADY